MEHFYKEPIFGGGFLADWDAWKNSKFVAESGAFAFYGILAHNLIVQTLSSGGIVGMLGLAAHIFTVGKRTAKKHTYARSFLGIAMGAFYFISMIDTIFYMAHFTFLYIAIVVAVEADVERATAVNKEENEYEGNANTTL